MNRKQENVFLFNGIGGKIKSGYRELSFLTTKCVTLNVPLKKDQTIPQLWVFLDQGIFNGGKRLDSPSDFLFDENQFIVIPHYPNQISGKIVTGMRSWPFRDENSEKNFVMEFNIRNVEVLERRKAM